MAVYAIGDVQGCYDELMGLLDEIHFDQVRDTLWFAGDLVNRGPDSLRVLRFVHGLGDNAITVLGNHDLHLLALAEGFERRHRSDTPDEILNAPDRDELLTWLRRQPLVHHDEDLRFAMVHAGLPPQWDLALAQQCAAEVENALRGDNYREFLANMYGNEPDTWNENLQGWDRLRFITNCFTRLRFCDADGKLCLKSKGEPGTQPPGYLPWFEVPGRKSQSQRLVFGHWSTLGLYRNNNVYSLDTGCLWGGLLTAMHLDSDMSIYSFACPGHHRPGS